MIAYSLADGINILSNTPVVLRHWLQDLPEAWLHANEGNDTFSPFDVVGHLLHGEKTDWIARLQIILTHGESRPFDPYDRFAQQITSQGKNIRQLLDEFESARAHNLQILHDTGLNEAQLDLTGMHPALGRVTLRNLLATWVAHDMTHLAQIARIMAKQYKSQVGPWAQYIGVLNDRE